MFVGVMCLTWPCHVADGTTAGARGRERERKRKRSWPPPTSFEVDAGDLGDDAGDLGDDAGDLGDDEELPRVAESPGSTEKRPILRVEAAQLRVAEVAARVALQELAVPGMNHGATGYPEWLAAAAGESGEGNA